MSRLAAGTLPIAIINVFKSVVSHQETGGLFSLYSAHDNTIMALLAHLGFRDFTVSRIYLVELLVRGNSARGVFTL